MWLTLYQQLLVSLTAISSSSMLAVGNFAPAPCLYFTGTKGIYPISKPLGSHCLHDHSKQLLSWPKSMSIYPSMGNFEPNMLSSSPESHSASFGSFLTCFRFGMTYTHEKCIPTNSAIESCKLSPCDPQQCKTICARVVEQSPGPASPQITLVTYTCTSQYGYPLCLCQSRAKWV